MSSNTTLNTGSGGDVIRTLDKTTYKTPSSVLDKGGSGAESLVTDANPLGVQLRDGTTASQVAAVSAGGALKVDNSGVTQPVSGTFFQATQPVSAASLPLPSGASTSANQSTGNTSLASIDGKTPALGQALSAASVPVVLPSAQITTLTPPAAITGFALEAGHLAAIDTATGRIPAQGQALAAASMPVVLPAAQITTLTPPAAITGFALDATLAGVLTTSDFDSKAGSLTETAPATDTASSGLNGRLQRIAQRLSSLITALGSPFQAGGSIGNTTFASTVADGANVALGTTTDASSASTLVGLLKNLKAALAGTLTVAGTVTATVTGATLAAGTALIGKVASVLSTDSIMNGTTALTPAFATVTLSATGQVVALQSSKKLRVLRYAIMADAACTVYFRTIATTTQISGSKYIAANGGAGGTFCPVGHFETLSGEALGLVISGTANVSVDVTYIAV